MNKEIITKEEMQEQTVDFWIQNTIFTDLQREEIKQMREGKSTLPHWTYEYDWKKDTKLQPWADEVLHSVEKMIEELYPEGYEVTVISGDTQRTYMVKKTIVEKLFL